ncbi:MULTISPECIES: ABC transporter ATP-binding protein [unclassified Salinivibrio]|uniref:ABC transporter ATP-binding protein n=1 Tax=unclassified Salinivibrio TaxID=2636825 RepID=UPI00092B4EA1|nr:MULTISPECIES: ABC transporter ATP-binding protein [unclassified Salinivibrio]MPS31880.1 ABC transporter ATP-binding protein [Salinivibrio sp. VYel7]MPX89690.1 ABC transporter ATP-binding protein [Salinivibrio sp. VYel1]MPX93274.1 ABC transporter ATP-binding protein [Salinivibrio sp. VYel9]MPX95899.1 ABC transporter ATP-binding protein [Salinivibrio sp. VYel6]MPX99492.1 ABC transporter ATP-binding protein [Salinivibrio sp. VYel4]
MASPVIRAEKIAKHVVTREQPLTILQDVSLQIEAGESIALMGVSGAGKSTLMTLLAGLDTPSEGEVDLLGHKLSTLDEDARAALRAESVGFVFQSFLLVPSLNALENVMLPLTIRGEEEDETRAKQLLASVGLQGRESHLPSQLSGGEQQRVALARAFIIRPHVLFADEPTGNLDQKTAATIIDLLFELNEKHGTTLVLVTHDPALAKRCQRTLMMDSGKLQERVNGE